MTDSSTSFTRFFTLGLFSMLIAGLLSSCSSTPEDQTFQTRQAPTRTELVLLNVPEGSGWVAYQKDAATGGVEDYRIVVIRQSTDEIIYDSVIPLSASMETHGFELSKDDPRLQNIAQNVDRNIIEPLESVIPIFQEETELMATQMEGVVPESQVEVVTPLVEAQPSFSQPPVTEPELVTLDEPVVEASPRVDEMEFPSIAEMDSPYPFLQRNRDQVIIGMPKPNSLKKGDRLFVRQSDRTISLPGDDQQSITTKGSLTGLIQVDSVKGRIATTILLSGYLPENPIFEIGE